MCIKCLLLYLSILFVFISKIFSAKKGLLGPKKELWNVLEAVEKYMPEASDITSSVRELPSVK